MANGRDLARAYSPGVAEACLEIKADPATAARYTTKGNLVAVISNGTAVLGLGNIGALASKPVMEGKAVLFKKFANIDCFDIELDEQDPEKLAAIVCALEPTFGAINLEDIRAPDCFIVEKLCRESMNIPVNVAQPHVLAPHAQLQQHVQAGDAGGPPAGRDDPDVLTACR